MWLDIHNFAIVQTPDYLSLWHWFSRMDSRGAHSAKPTIAVVPNSSPPTLVSARTKLPIRKPESSVENSELLGNRA